MSNSSRNSINDQRLLAVRHTFLSNTPDGHEDLDTLKDALFDLSEDPTDAQARALFMVVPESTVADALNWGLGDTEARESLHQFIRENRLAVREAITGPAPQAEALPVQVVSRLRAILADADVGPPVDGDWCCLECGKWTPWNHPEAHEHADDCRAPAAYAKRRDWKARLRALLDGQPEASPAAEDSDTVVALRAEVARLRAVP